MMDIPRLFATYADNNLDKWQSLINCEIEHSIFGLGKIINISQPNRTINIECVFDDAPLVIRKFGPATFEKHFLVKLIVPSEISGYLVELREIEREKAVIRDREEKRKKAEELEKEQKKIEQENKLAQMKEEEERRKKTRQQQQEQFSDLIKKADQYYDNESDEELIAVGQQFAHLLSNVISLQNKITSVCKKIVSAFLTHSDVEEALQWIDKIDDQRYDVLSIKESLLKIKENQKGLLLEDIKDPKLLNELAALHKTLLAQRKAISIYKRSLEIEPNNCYVNNSVGGIYKNIGQYDEAIDQYREGYRNGGSKVSLTGAGAAFRAKKTDSALNKAIDCYNKALEIDQNDVYANNGIGAVYFDLGRYDEGALHFMVAADTEHLMSLFYQYKENNQLETALKCLYLILRNDPGHLKANSLLRQYSNNNDAREGRL